MWLINDVIALRGQVKNSGIAQRVLVKQIQQVDKVLPFAIGSNILTGLIFYVMLEFTFNLTPYQHALSLVWLIYHTSVLTICWFSWHKIIKTKYQPSYDSLKNLFTNLFIFFAIAGSVGLLSLVSLSRFHDHSHDSLSLIVIRDILFGLAWLIYHAIVLYMCLASWKTIEGLAKKRQIIAPLYLTADAENQQDSLKFVKSNYHSDYLANYAAYSVLLICTLLSGCLWALGVTKVIMTNIEHFTQIIVLIGLHFGMLSGAMSSIGIFRWVYVAFAVPSLITWSITLLYVDEPRLMILSIAVIMLVITSSYFAKFNWLNSVSTIQIYLENTQLVSELKIKSKALEKASIAKTKFLASASHDLRQPVHALSLFIETLAGTELDSHQEKIVTYAKKASQSSRDMLNSILDYSHLESGEMKPNVVSTKLDDIIQTLVDEFSVQAQNKNLTLRYHKTKHCVESDPAMLSLILRNFLSNAIRYTSEGGVLIGARLLTFQNQENSTQFCRVSVWDTGSGLKPDEKEVIFDSFQQLERNNQNNQGLGLGLSIAKGLAHLLTARINVKSQLGRGSQFYIDLPVCSITHEDVKAQPIIHNDIFQSLTILVIDDEQSVLTSMKLLLESWGCQVWVGYTVEEAIKAFEAHQPRIVITDFHLANSATGEDVILAINELSDYRVEFILLTGNTSPKLVQSANRTNLTMLYKPIDPKILLSNLHSIASNLSPSDLEKP